MKSLFEDYKKFERIAKNYVPNSTELDTSSEYFLAPTTLIPLFCFANEQKSIKKLIAHNNDYYYLDMILKGEASNTNTSYTILPNTKEKRLEDETAKVMAGQINTDIYGGHWTIFHICNELINNVYDHTPFEEGFANQGYTYAQEYPNKMKLDICVMDDGLSIPGCFERNGVDFIDDCDAIYKATQQVSTSKQGPGLNNDRGNGLWSTLKLVVEENGGSALIVSRNGCLNIESKGKFKYHHLDNNNIFKGTLISLRLKNNQVQNYHDVIELTEYYDYTY